MINSFLHLLFISVVALFPVINPIGSALIINPYFLGVDSSKRKSVVRKIAFYTFCVGSFSLIAGHLILTLFGVTISVIQIAGGVMICKTGWESLGTDKSGGANTNTPKGESADIGSDTIDNLIFYPITFPLTIGGGVIAVLFTLGAHSMNTNIANYFINTSAVLVAIIVMCLMIVFFYNNTKVILNYFGSRSENIVNRLMAFLLFCVGLQIAITGVKAIF